MPKILIIGNCQAAAVQYMLAQSPSFCKKFTWKIFPAVFEITKEQVDELHQELKTTDVLLIQPIGEDYRNNLGVGTKTLMSFLPFGAKTITWPSIFWNGYNPEMFYMKNVDGNHITERFDYHHALIFRCFLERKSVEETLAALQNPQAYLGNIQSALQGLDELTRREENLDIKISAYIKENFRKQRLFWTLNHPTNAVLEKIAEQALDILGCTNNPQKSTSFWSKLFSAKENGPVQYDLPKLPEFLSSYCFPVLPGVYQGLELEFSEQPVYRLGGKKIEIFHLVAGYFEFYRSHPELMEINQSVVNGNNSYVK